MNSLFTKNFYFKGDLEYDINENVRLFSTDMKNSTIEYSKDGINYNNLEFTVSFNKRTNQEARAILKYLDDKAGFKIFSYTLPQPYNKTISVYCPEWNHTYNFADNHTIKARLVESKFNYIVNDQFDTALNPSGINFGFVPLGFSKKQIVKVKNNENKPVTFTISSDIFDPISAQNTDVDFVHQLDSQSPVQTADAGWSVDYTIDCDVDRTLKKIHE